MEEEEVSYKRGRRAKKVGGSEKLREELERESEKSFHKCASL